jgi:uncharacterized protein (TIGR03435 family)
MAMGLAILVQSQPQFDVASVKPATAQGLMLVRPLPGRLTANASLQMLMQNAYGVQAFQIVGGPDWLRADRFAVDATAAGATSRSSILMMLQSLLEDRFHLKFHRETRELPAYALVAARTSPRLTPAKEGGCAEPTANAPVDWAGGKMAPSDVGTTALPQCGNPRVMLRPFGAQMQARKVRMADLAKALSLVMGRTVIDRTGIEGLFDLDLNFNVDETTTAMPPPPPGMAPPVEMTPPTMFTALQEQLGLRLESAKGPVEVLVVEHADKPPAN